MSAIVSIVRFGFRIRRRQLFDADSSKKAAVLVLVNRFYQLAEVSTLSMRFI
jgi:hypothetical protein